MPRHRDLERLFIGVGDHAVAIDPSSGKELWRTKLKGSSFVTIHVSGDRLYAGAGGELFGLDQSTGEILWQNKLKGLGLGGVAFPGGADAMGMQAALAQDAT